MVCERFTTSKLETFDDLENIGTFGFRGEALASISQVSHVTITTKRAEDQLGYKATYRDGKLAGKNGASSEPQPCASTVGTQFLVDDLFYNYPLRKTSMSPSEEYARIYDVVTRYALHFAGVAFNLKKLGENKADVSTKRTNTVRDNIRELFGVSISRDLIPLDFTIGAEDEISGSTKPSPSNDLSFSISGFVSGPTSSPRKNVFVLFVNNRLVNMSPLKKFLESQYVTLMAKNTSFIYIALRIHPTKVDVNLHPSKQEIGLVDQQAIIAKIGEYFASEIDKFSAQHQFRENQATAVTEDVIVVKTHAKHTLASTASIAPTIVRSDAREGSIKSYLGPRKSITSSEELPGFGDLVSDEPVSSTPTSTNNVGDVPFDAQVDLVTDPSLSSSRRTSISPLGNALNGTVTNDSTLSGHSTRVPTESAPRAIVERSMVQRAPTRAPERQTRLLSTVAELIDDLERNKVDAINKVLRDSTIVGHVSSRKLMVQANTVLYMLDITAFSRELIYQECLHRLGEVKVFELEEAAPLEDLLMLMLEHSPERPRLDSEMSAVAAAAAQLLIDKRELLEEYFGIVISEDGRLIGLPEVVQGYQPSLDGLPEFCYNLACKVDWRDEKETLSKIAREVACLYAIPSEEEPTDLANGAGGNGLVSSGTSWAVEHQIWPALLLRFAPQPALKDSNAIVVVVSTAKLFKIFDRC